MHASVPRGHQREERRGLCLLEWGDIGKAAQPDDQAVQPALRTVLRAGAMQMTTHIQRFVLGAYGQPLLVDIWTDLNARLCQPLVS